MKRAGILRLLIASSPECKLQGGERGGKEYAIYWADISSKGSIAITKIIILVDYISRFCVTKLPKVYRYSLSWRPVSKTSLSAHQFLGSSDRAKTKIRNK